MKFYRILSGIRLLKSYSSKFMFVGFIGVHVPLLGIVAVLIATTGDHVNKTSFFLLTLGLTLLACVVTLAVLHSLTAPLRLTQKQLAGFLISARQPALPTDLTDETGLLMQDISTLVDRQQELRLRIKVQSAEIMEALSHLKNQNTPEAIATHTKTIADAVNKQLQLLDETGRAGSLNQA